MDSASIFRIVGIVLLILGASSGLALFLRAVLNADTKEAEKATSTLWGLFIVGLIGGIVMRSCSR
jgi:hypothetical protein